MHFNALTPLSSHRVHSWFPTNELAMQIISRPVISRTQQEELNLTNICPSPASHCSVAWTYVCIVCICMEVSGWKRCPKELTWDSLLSSRLNKLRDFALYSLHCLSHTVNSDSICHQTEAPDPFLRDFSLKFTEFQSSNFSIKKLSNLKCRSGPSIHPLHLDLDWHVHTCILGSRGKSEW